MHCLKRDGEEGLIPVEADWSYIRSQLLRDRVKFGNAVRKDPAWGWETWRARLPTTWLARLLGKKHPKYTPLYNKVVTLSGDGLLG